MTNVLLPRNDSLGNTGWQTPEEAFLSIEREFGPFEMDPASAHGCYVASRVPVYCTPEGTFQNPKFTDRNGTDWTPIKLSDEDGLTCRWQARVFVNPPYRNVEPWVKKARDSALEGVFVVMLLAPSTDAGWFHDYIYDAELERPRDRVRYRLLRGRIRFVHPDPERRETDFKGFRPISGNMIVVFYPPARLP